MEARTVVGPSEGALPHFTPLARVHYDAVGKLYKCKGDQNEGRVRISSDV